MSIRNSTHKGVRRITVDNFGSGSVTIEPNAQSDLVECSIDATDERFLEAVQVRPESGGLRLIFPSATDRDMAAHLRLGVPDDLEYAIKVGSANLTIRAIIGRSKVTSGSGDVSVGQAADLECATGSGHISVGTVQGRAARLISGSGEITIEEAHCPVSAKSGSGDVTLRWVHHHGVQANSGSGDITVPSTTGSVDLRTATGSLAIGVADGLPAWLDLESVTGEISIGLESAAEPRPGEPYVSVRARTASGDIDVHRA